MNGSTNPATGTSNTTETASLTGLAPDTTYYFNIEATSSVGTTYGATVRNFTTSTAAPTASTSAATSVSGTGATLNGTVDADGISTTVTFCYSTSSLTNCTGGTVTTVNGSTTPVTGNTNTTETAALTGLTPNTTYYFQIKAVNSDGTVYGAATNFITSEAPTATTSAASGTTATASTLNGTVNAENASTSVSFCYSTSSSLDQLLGTSPP